MSERNLNDPNLSPSQRSRLAKELGKTGALAIPGAYEGNTLYLPEGGNHALDTQFSHRPDATKKAHYLNERIVEAGVK